ncbi:MAG: phosphoribosylaminoimidazolesuccinocarboxamide synthase [Deltaproteobacteria bacterium]|nr:phosphoribosylaminoimidazolesuccinocarboxamide synthase [Deltaproteobacteria bacterium]
MLPKGLISTDFKTLTLRARGKVRDIYETDHYLLIVATDRISAFDVVMPNPIPGKGKILTQLSVFWFGKTKDIIENHLISANLEDFPEECRPYADELEGRSMLVKKANPLPVECIVRGYLSGSGWKDYLQNKSISGIRLPEGLKESSRLAEPLFTPSTKAEAGQHDVTITRKNMEEIIGRDLTAKIIETSIAIYTKAEKIAEGAGIIIADTKMEFGLTEDGLILIDELLTPDSSRFWPHTQYEEGKPQKSFDKQFLRDYLLSIQWNQRPPAPELPEDIINKTREKYEEVLNRFCK